MPRRKYYGYYRGRYQGRGRYAFAAHMIAYPIAFIVLAILAFVVSQPWLALAAFVGLVGVVLIVKARSSRKAVIPKQDFRPLALRAHVERDYRLTDAQAEVKNPTRHEQKTRWPETLPKVLPCGHEYKVENVYLDFDGNRNCRICLKERSKNYPIRVADFHYPLGSAPPPG